MGVVVRRHILVDFLIILFILIPLGAAGVAMSS